MYWQILIISLALLQSCAVADVLKLTDDTFHETIKNNPFVMVTFTAPWCGHCKQLAPEYEKAAKQIEEQGKPFILANLDATENKKATEEYKIEGYPTIKLFINEKVVDYDGERSAEALIAFLEKKSSPPSTELKSKEDIEKVKEEKNLRCILGSSDENILGVYREVAMTEDDYLFYHTSPDLLTEVFPEAKKDTIVLLKDFDEGKVLYEESIEVQKLKDFLAVNSVPIVADIDLKIIQLVFSPNDKNGIFLFRKQDAAETKTIEEEFKRVATELRSPNLIFALADLKSEWGARVAEVFGITESDLPLLEFVGLEEDIVRYRHTGELKDSAIKQFISDCKEGKAERFMKSEPEPQENNGPVFTVVGKTFQRDVLDNDDDIMVLFYAEWCGHCKKFEPIYEELAKSLSGNKKLKFMKIDGTKNDVEGIAIQGFPTIKFYVGNNKAEPLSYEGERTEADVAKFIKEKASNSVDIPDFESDDEADVGKEDL